MTPLQGGLQASKTTSLPTRLYDWRLSKNQETFAYGGDEVDLSVWSTEKAFSTAPEPSSDPLAGKKRKRDALFPGETWRAKNVSMVFILYHKTDVLC
jgi:ribosome biogenesis protein NSA1